MSALFISLAENKTDWTPQKYFLLNIALISHLAITFFICIENIASLIKGKRAVLNLLGVVVLFTYWYSLPTPLSEIHIIQYIVINVCSHFFVSFSFFIFSKNERQFWEYNKILFLRIFSAFLFSAALYLGLLTATLSAEYLFDLKSFRRIYIWLFFTLAGFYNTVFFLSGIPSSLDQIPSTSIFPKALQIFVQFVLLPLVFIYFIILYIYLGKITISWSLPKGFVSKGIIVFSFFAILSLLLIHPIKDNSKNKWIEVLSRYFYLFLLPLIFLLTAAIGFRLNQYGITENRYVVAVLGLSLFIFSLYFLLSKNKSIKFIPITLCLLGLFSLVGPLSMFEASRGSQLRRLEKKLRTLSVLNEKNLYIPSSKPRYFSDENYTKIMSHFLYLKKYRFRGIEKWFPGDPSINKKLRSFRAEEVSSLIGLNSVKLSSHFSRTRKFNSFPFDVSGFDQIFKIKENLNSKFFNFRFSKKTSILKLSIYNDEYSIDLKEICS